VTLRHWADDAFTEAIGGERRVDPVLPTTGGPAGNARLTAWTGLVLLVLFLVELATLLNLDGLIDWHIVVGTLLVPPALLKTASTGWRILRYYTARPAYRRAGPPPMLLRVLGPLVVLCTLAVLGSGIALSVVGPDPGRNPFLDVLGYPVSALTVHQGTFVLWAIVTGLHTLGRFVPAVRIVMERPPTPTATVPGRMSRASLLTLSLAAAAISAAIVLNLSGGWTSGALHHFGHHHTPERTSHAGR
jgi:hypothetical protein